MRGERAEHGLTVRKAELRDAEAIYILNREGFGYDFNLEKTCQRLKYILGNTGDMILIAEQDGKAAGYIHAAGYECTYAESMKNILAVVVDEKQRGKGIGKALLSAVEAWAKESGSYGIRLVSGYDRKNAHRFYLACGYRDRKDQKNFTKIFSEL